MDDLDSILGALAAAPAHPRLVGMETRLAARIAADRRERELSLGASLAAVAVALGFGLVSGQVTVGRPLPQSVALDAGLDLAPSSRLVTNG